MTLKSGDIVTRRDGTIGVVQSVSGTGMVEVRIRDATATWSMRDIMEPGQGDTLLDPDDD